MYNGDTMAQTYQEGGRILKLRDLFDQRKNLTIRMINGTGETYEKTFWLNLAAK